MAVDEACLKELKPQAYAEVRGEVRDPDLLLCSARDPFSRLIRWATKSPWSHVAMAFRMEEIDRVLVLECVEKIGVRCVPMSTFLTRTSEGTSPYPGQILLARHKGLAAKSRARPMKKMAGAAFDRLGDRFSPAEILKIAARIAVGRLNRATPKSLGPRDEYICSEYVAKCYGEIGLTFPWDELGFMAPCDIAADPRVEPVALIRT
jgi:hypothetical protein